MSKTGDHLIDDLALVIALNPKASLTETAKKAGISKATLYRFSGSRQNLNSKVERHCITVYEQILAGVELAHDEPIEVMRTLIKNHLKYKGALLYISFRWREDQISSTSDTGNWKPYWATLDAFFIRCQLAGTIRADIPATACSVMFINLILAMVRAERIGRTAVRESAALIEKFFMHGALASGTLLRTGSTATSHSDVHGE